MTDDCPSGAEYEGCGDHLILNHYAGGADSLLLGPQSEVQTEVTLVPCRADYEHQIPTKVVVQFTVYNELEVRFSASTTVDCWGNFFLDSIRNIFDVGVLQTRFVETQMRPANGANSGFVGVAEEYHVIDGRPVRVAYNIHEAGTRAQTDLIFIPEGP